MKRIDAKPLLLGRGDFFDDVGFEGRYGVIAGSPHAHARIVKIDTAAAEKAGAKVLTGRTMIRAERTLLVQRGGEEESTREGASMSTSPLAVDKVRYQGEPVAFVIGGSPYEAADLPDIEVNILPTPSPSTPMGAKGIGEIPVGVAAAAVTSAVEDVLKRRVTKIPIEI